MIVRIMGEGQLVVDGDLLDVLNNLDGTLESALDAGDEPAFRAALSALLDKVRAAGKPLSDDTLEPSELILPPADASMDEVREMLGEDGLIPG